MRCPKCNKELEVVEQFCSGCGCDLEEEAIKEMQIVEDQIAEQKRILEELECQKHIFDDGDLIKKAEECRKKRMDLLMEIADLEKNLEICISRRDEKSANTFSQKTPENEE